MELPYQIDPGQAMSVVKEGMGWAEMQDALLRFESDSILQMMIGKVSSSPEYVGICLIIGSAWGYTVQYEAIQLRDGSFLLQKWSDVDLKGASGARSIDLGIDLREELRLLREEDYALGSFENENPDLVTGIGGRYSRILVAVGSEGEWLGCQGLLSGGRYRNNAFNRLFCAIAGLDESVTLV